MSLFLFLFLCPSFSSLFYLCDEIIDAVDFSLAKDFFFLLPLCFFFLFLSTWSLVKSLSLSFSPSLFVFSSVTRSRSSPSPVYVLLSFIFLHLAPSQSPSLPLPPTACCASSLWLHVDVDTKVISFLSLLSDEILAPSPFWSPSGSQCFALCSPPLRLLSHDLFVLLSISHVFFLITGTEHEIDFSY